ncbi:hypothetical protein ANO11243_096530 [Dothideomycetidae sp. 11243]|nr:hypothetical protein ANO11243_096530 [fungal sp. No.11243]
MFAYHAGIIDSGVPAGRIMSDEQGGAYAMILKDDSEFSSPNPNMFTYKAKPYETGRFRLTACTSKSRQPVRVLRCHTLRSFWAPRAGLRYDGLYKVSGWKVKTDPHTKVWIYDIDFVRLEGQRPMDQVLRHPLAEEVDDYTEYKRIRRLAAQNQNPLHRARPLVEPTRLNLRSPGAPVIQPTTTNLDVEANPADRGGEERSRSRKSGLRLTMPEPVLPRTPWAGDDDVGGGKVAGNTLAVPAQSLLVARRSMRDARMPPTPLEGQEGTGPVFNFDFVN